jgi:hypothetical protein
MLLCVNVLPIINDDSLVGIVNGHLDTQQNDTQHRDTQHKGLICDIQHK